MRVGILQAGRLPADLEELVGPYARLFRSALGDSFEYCEIDVTRGELPPPHSAADAFIITGSAAGVHDADVWIDEFTHWLRQLDPAIPLVGICFGHQLMAQAYGGHVETSQRGWGLGLHEYSVIVREAWMDDARTVVLPVTHRDQVVRMPPTARVIASSDFCPNAALTYDDRRAISFQSHPELTVDLTAKLIEHRAKQGIVDAAAAEAARASLRLQADRERVMGWIRRFYRAA